MLRRAVEFVFLFTFCVWINSACMAAQQVTPPKEWTVFIQNLQKEMLAKGISQKTIERAYKGKNYYHKVSAAVQSDEKQTEFILTTCDYVNRLVSADRVRQARKEYNQLSKKYKDIEEKYGVPLYYLTAFWAVETNFGRNKGQHNLIDSLTNLSYRNRRSKFFKNELYNVLKIMEKHDLSGEKIKGSWAGAMGHFQFMPSTYNYYAVDYDGNNVPDIWTSFPDALASAANYLHKLGWKQDEPWGKRVDVPWNFDYKYVGLKITKKVSEWKELGVLSYNGSKLNFDDDMKASVIMPDGRKGPAYLVFGNFKRIMIWNHSDNYALAVAILADYIKHQNKKYVPLTAGSLYVMNNDEIREIQKFYNKIFSKKIKEDGKLGPQTREAVKKLQKKVHLPQDGYPDYQLLNKMKNYESLKGFLIPLPQKRSRK